MENGNEAKPTANYTGLNIDGVSSITPMHKMIIFLCEQGEYDLVDKANELLKEEREVIEKAHFNGLINSFTDPKSASSYYYKSNFSENTAF